MPPTAGAASLGLVGYTCTGTGVRPDLEQAQLHPGGPAGDHLRRHRRPLPDGGGPSGPQNYCCTSAPTDLRVQPGRRLPAGTYDYQCQDINRPESYNPDIKCGQGVRGPEYVDYCCSGTSLPLGCSEDDTLGCAAGLVGWALPDHAGRHPIPKGQDLLANKSRADQYYLRLLDVPSCRRRAR